MSLNRGFGTRENWVEFVLRNARQPCVASRARQQGGPGDQLGGYQMGAQIEAFHDREYGPRPLSGPDVLKNLREIHNPAALSRFGGESTARRIVELIHTPL